MRIKKKARKHQQLTTYFATQAEHNARMLELASNYQNLCDEIDGCVIAAANLVSKLDPLVLQQRAYGEYIALALNKRTEVELEETNITAQRMIDYVQCLIVSIPPSADGYVDLTEELWQTLKQLIDAIFSKLTSYFIASSAHRSLETNSSEAWEEFFTRTQMNWCFVKGDRHLYHLRSHLKSLLQIHDDVLNDLFGISAITFVDELEKIRIALTTGMIDAGLKLKNLHQEFFEQLKQDENSELEIEEDLGNFFRRKMEEYGQKAKFEAELGRFVGLDLFDLSKVTNLPSALLDNLSLSPGEDLVFLQEGSFRGWPLRLWPTWNKPFLRVNDRYYCFDMYLLSDNIYRAIQKMIYCLKPEYKTIWNDRQQAASENLPFQLFAKLLPGAIFYKSVYYKSRTGQNGKFNWIECDGLILYDDHLFIVEVKAGAFTYTPPATDAPAYIESIKSLLFKPAEQGQRFLNYLESSDSVVIYDKNHSSIGEISHKQFRQITICCITVDQLTEFAAKSSHLQAIEGGLPGTNIWNVSIDDLRVYTDILQNPLQFLHFIEQRHDASKTDLILLDDELEHLGLYIARNRYVQYAEELVVSNSERPDLLVWAGFTSEIDRYYSRLLSLEYIEPPQQKFPLILTEILGLLSKTKKLGRAKAASVLLDMSGETRENFAQQLPSVLRLIKETRRPHPFSLLGDTCITVYCKINTLSLSGKFDITEHVLANIVIGNEQERLLLELLFNKNNDLLDLNFSFLTARDVDKFGRKRIEMLADNLSKERVAKELVYGKIGRNTPCPCGSGKKYKHCHERRNN